MLGSFSSLRALPATIAISVLRHRLFDIELVLSRTLTYAALTLLVVGAYAALLRGERAFRVDRLQVAGAERRVHCVLKGTAPQTHVVCAERDLAPARAGEQLPIWILERHPNDA